MNTIRFTVPGTPKALARPRFSRHGKFVRTYDPASNDLAKGNVVVIAAVNKPETLLTGPIGLYLEFWMPRPKSHYRTGKHAGQVKESMLEAAHTSKPDLDNLIKLVKDALTGIIWKDDSQINQINAIKGYAETPRTEIEIRY